MSIFNRLWVQLTLAFALIILATVGTLTAISTRRADIEFRRYITHSQLRLSDSIADRLLRYYQKNGGWQGIGPVLEQSLRGPQPIWPRRGHPGAPPARPVQLTLTNSRGRVLYDSAHELETRRLSARQLDNGYPIVDPESDEVVGYLLLSLPMPNQLGPLETQFLDRLQRLVAIGVAISVTLALIVSAVFSRTLTAPLRDLADAAKAVAAGDFRQRVPVQGSTEIAQVAKNFNEMTKALEQGEQLRKNMVADVAHELRTPVSVLQGNLRAILDQVYPLSEAEIARLYDETRLLGRLIDDLRELAQADAGQLTLHTQRIAIEPWLRNHVQKFAPAADLKHIDLQLEIQPDLPSLHGDPDRLAEVISNLLNNALRHTPEGGQITVSTQRSPQSPEAIEVTVEDTGKGIAPEDLPHIFDRFWRADRSRSRAYGGSGLGLAIAQSLIKAHGGRIWAESSLGQGSRFTVWLPLT